MVKDQGQICVGVSIRARTRFVTKSTVTPAHPLIPPRYSDPPQDLSRSRLQKEIALRVQEAC